MYLTRRAFCASVALGSALLPRAAAAQRKPFYVTVVRATNLATTLQLTDCVYGHLYVGEEHYLHPLDALPQEAFCDTLELPFRDNRNDISACLPGAYAGTVVTAPTNERHNLGWRIRLEGTLGHQGVEIHIGNKSPDTVGCILVGKRGRPPAPTVGCWVGSSGMMIAALQAMYGDGSLQRPVAVKVANRA